MLEWYDSVTDGSVSRWSFNTDCVDPTAPRRRRKPQERRGPILLSSSRKTGRGSGQRKPTSVSLLDDRMAAYGAFCPLPSASATVRLLNRLRTLDLGGGDYSSAPNRSLRPLNGIER
jgi:hypothetical protein